MGSKIHFCCPISIIFTCMKNLILKFIFSSLIYCACGCACLYGQTPMNLPQLKPDQLVLVCTYNCEYRIDSLSSKKRIETMKLEIGHTLSRFESSNARRLDSLIKEAVNNTFQQKQASQPTPIQFNSGGMATSMYSTHFRQLIYKLPAQQKIVTYERIGTVKYVYVESQSVLNWHITSAQADINGYHCQQALTHFAGRTWEAWFTKEIPVTDGPYKFCGLPGLIVKVQDTRNWYTFNLVYLTKTKNSVSIALPTAPAIETNKKAFIAGKDSYERTIAERLANQGVFGNQTPQELKELKNKTQARLAAQNNPIELE